MKRKAWMLIAAYALAAGLVACGQQLVDEPFEQNQSDMGEVDMSAPIVVEHDMAKPPDAGEMFDLDID